MKNIRIIESLSTFDSENDIMNFSEIEIFDFEYLIKYLEINQGKLKEKYKYNFELNWKVKLSISFLIIYKKYLNSNDIRILNLMFKSIKLIKSLDIKFSEQEMHKLIIFHLNKLKYE
jgi:hypothetical protein